MRDAPDGDVAPIRVPQPLGARARAHRRDHDRSSASSRTSCSATATWAPSPTPSGGAMPELAERLAERIRRHGPARRSRPSWRPRSTTPTGGFYATGGRAGRRSGDFLTVARGRPAVRRRAGPRPRRVVGRARPARSPFVVVDAGAGPGHPGPRACWRPGRPWPSRRPPLRRRGAVGGPAGGATPAWPWPSVEGAARRSRSSGCRGGQRAARQPALRPRGARRRLAGGLRRRRRRRASGRGARPVLRRCRPCLPPTAPHGARRPVQDEAAALGGRRAGPPRPPGGSW